MMYKTISLIVLFLFFGITQAQELNCRVTINADRIPNSNRTIFKTLEQSLTDFINNTKWADQVYEQEEKIECTVFINLSEYTSDIFSGSIQVQSVRPIFNSSYFSTVFNHNDKDFSFRYQEFEKLYFNPNSFDSNLVSTIAFYVKIILGLDRDTFALKEGTPFFAAAQQIANIAQEGSYKGWKQSEKTLVNRAFLINDLLSNSYAPFREALYQYHFEGLDIMSDNPELAKENIKKALITLGKLHQVRPNALLTRVFFDAKSDEIVSIFSDGPKITVADLLDNLNKISPLYMNKWSHVKY